MLMLPIFYCKIYPRGGALLVEQRYLKGVKKGATVIVRKVDDLGRIVLPAELRRTLGIEVKDSLEIFSGEESIILRKYSPVCILCGESDKLVVFHRKYICRACIANLSE